MDRNQVINWLRENTTREQWFEHINTGFFKDTELQDFAFTVGKSPIEEGKPRYYVYVVEPTGQPTQYIHYSDVFEQPVFIDGAEYVLHGLNGLDFSDEPFKYNLDGNKFTLKHENTIQSINASGFGTKFTVELVHADVDDLIDEVKSGGKSANDVRGILSKQPVKPQSSLYDRVVKALGNRDVPIGGEDHLVGQVAVDHSKAVLLDKVIKEFNIPVGGDVIQWLYNRTKTQESPEIHHDGLINGLKHLLGLNVDSGNVELFNTVEKLVLINDDIRVKRGVARNKYDREILPGIYVDVYDVLAAFTTNSAAIDHAVKKLLAPGQRGVKDRVTDLNEAISSIQREIERLDEWSDKPLGMTEDEIIDAALSVFDKPSGGSIPKGKSYVISEKGPTTYKPHEVPDVDIDGVKYEGDNQ